MWSYEWTCHFMTIIKKLISLTEEGKFGKIKYAWNDDFYENHSAFCKILDWLAKWKYLIYLILK